MKKSTSLNLLIGTVLLLSVSCLGLFTLNTTVDLQGEESTTIDCDTYFSEVNGYTSLFEIVSDLNGGTTNVSYKTWGTVTKYYLDSSEYKNFYLQSTDRYGNVAGMMVYRSSAVVSEGSVLTVEGNATLYNNLPEFNNPSIVVDYPYNSSPVTTYVTPESFWLNATNPSSSEYLNAESMGTRKVMLENVVFSSVSSGNASVQFSGGNNVVLYYSSLLNTASIYSSVSSLNGYTVDIVGYVDCYNNGSSAQMRCLLRSADDIIAEGVSYSLSLDNGTYGNIGDYSTGNYGSKNVGSYSFEHYRANQPSSSTTDFIVLLPYVNHFNDGSIPGSLYNTSSIRGIESIAITYRTASAIGQKPVISYGPNIATVNETELALSTTNITSTLNLTNTNFFKVETSENIMYIVDIDVNYSNSGSSDTYTYLGSGLGAYRINPVTSTGSLYEGKSVTVPTGIARNGSYYTITSSKTYTYYSFSYVQSNPSLAALSAYTDPLDVAAFYTAFGTSPANYVAKADYSSAYYVFRDDARCVSVYSRTDGYATAVPYQVGQSGVPQYYELDIAFDSSYSGSNRGVGRVVAWQYGFDDTKGATNYDDSPVCVYTDDHYATFQEYLNAGAYGTRFNAEMSRTDYVWGTATTLQP